MKKITIGCLLILMTNWIAFGQTKKTILNYDSFLPKGYIIFEKIFGDLNNDALDECVLIIKDTNKDNIIVDKYRGKLDRNRRGIIVHFNKKNHYELVTKNLNCFSSENEDGGVYYAPELNVEIQKGNLYVGYAHGRYGNWKYAFKFINSDFKLIGYDETNGGVVIQSQTSVNFLTKTRLEKVNVNKNAEGSDEIFKETSTTIKEDKLIKLSEIPDFDELDFS